MNELLTLGAAALARRIRAGEVSPAEVLEAHIARIEAVNPYINAIACKVYDRARAEARDAGRRLVRAARAHEPLPALFGVPCTIKEHYAVAGLPQTGGLRRRRHAVATADSTPTRRMREAGLIVMATTNVPEALTWHESCNRVYGRTCNPHALAHSAGGSSGSEGAVIAAGGSPVGLGGDIGGSIRIPAVFNGICGHKPSGGRVPETGAWPGARGLIGRYKVVGPLARRVEDLQAVMPYLAGPDGVDPSVDGPPWGEPRAFDPRRVSVWWFESNGIIAPADEVRDAVRRTAAVLADMGCRVAPWRPRGIGKSLRMWVQALESAGGPRFRDVLGDFAGIDLPSEWLKALRGESDHILPCLVLATIEAVLTRLPHLGRRMDEQRHALRAEIEGKLGPDGVLVCPAFHRTAPRHGLESFLHTAGFIYSGAFNPLELPATAVPVGFSARGLPLGVQVVGIRHNDHLTLQVAACIEAAFGGWRPAPLGADAHANPTPRPGAAPAGSACPDDVRMA